MPKCMRMIRSQLCRRVSASRPLFWLAVVLVLLASCATPLDEALLMAGDSGLRTFADILITDLYAALPTPAELFPPPEVPPEEEDGGEIPEGDPQRGQELFVANDCYLCHCEDARGGCLAAALNIQGATFQMVDDRTRGATSHPGGKFSEFTDQDVADIAEFLASLATQ